MAVALAGAVKAKALTAAKAELANGSTHQIDEVVRLNGIVSKGLPTDGCETTTPATVQIQDSALIAELMRRLDVSADELKKALRAAFRRVKEQGDLRQLGQGSDDEALRDVIAAEADRLAARLPALPKSIPGRAATVTSQITVTPIEDKQCLTLCKRAA